jgi:BlaI family transcriptional regulator, penicillinase repressor
MSRNPVPTDSELEILQVLWSRGASTVREVHTTLRAKTSYTTTLKLLQNMHAKGLVRRDDSSRQHIYEARAREDATLSDLVQRLVTRVFNGSGAALALYALGDRTVSAEELAELKRTIREKDPQR